MGKIVNIIMNKNIITTIKVNNLMVIMIMVMMDVVEKKKNQNRKKYKQNLLNKVITNGEKH